MKSAGKTCCSLVSSINIDTLENDSLVLPLRTAESRRPHLLPSCLAYHAKLSFHLSPHELNRASQVDARELKEIPLPLYLLVIG